MKKAPLPGGLVHVKQAPFVEPKEDYYSRSKAKHLNAL